MFNNPAARAAFFEKLKQKQSDGMNSTPMNSLSTPPLGPKPARTGLNPSISPAAPSIPNMSLPKLSNVPTEKPARFKKIQSYMKG